MTGTLREDALKVAVLKAIRDEVDQQLDDTRKHTTAGLLDARKDTGLKTLDVELPDGSKVATISLVQPGSGFNVDQAGFMAWVRENHPDEIVTAVRESFRRAVLDRLVLAGDVVVDKATGEAVPWATFRPPPTPSTFALRFVSGGRGAIADAWQAGHLDGYAPGPKAVT